MSYYEIANVERTRNHSAVSPRQGLEELQAQQGVLRRVMMLSRQNRGPPSEVGVLGGRMKTSGAACQE